VEDGYGFKEIVSILSVLCLSYASLLSSQSVSPNCFLGVMKSSGSKPICLSSNPDPATSQVCASRKLLNPLEPGFVICLVGPVSCSAVSGSSSVNLRSMCPAQGGSIVLWQALLKPHHLSGPQFYHLPNWSTEQLFWARFLPVRNSFNVPNNK
jgi:hypothetical protein